jgi:hypothetical protein
MDRRRAQAASSVNVYAVVALVAALLGLFPVAIVFGLLAFTRPGSRGMPTAAIALGLAEVAGALAFLVLGVSGRAEPAPAAATATFTIPVEPRLPVPTIMLPARPAPPSAAPAATATTTDDSSTTTTTTTDAAAAAATTAAGVPTSSVATGVSANALCDPSQNGLIRPGSSGSTMVCTNIGENGAYRWSPAGPLAGGVHPPGTPCDPISVGGLTGHTADGHAVACEGDGHNGAWTTG